MEMKTMQKIEQGLCEVLDDYAQKGISNPSDVETVKHALSGLQKILVIDAMEHGRSGDVRYYDGGSGRSYGSYDGGSYDSSGRRYRRSYDYDSMRSGQDMRQQLEQMMQQAGSERERMAIKDALQKL